MEPDITVEKSPATLCEPTPSTLQSKPNSNVMGSSLSGDENNLTSETLVKIQKAFSESGSNLHDLINHRQSPVTNVGKEKLSEISDIGYSPEKSLLKTNDLTVRESVEKYENHTGKDENCFSEIDLLPYQTQKFGREATIKCYSTETKVKHEKDVHLKYYLNEQESPNDEQIKGQQSPRDKLNTTSKENENMMEEKCSEMYNSKGG